MNDILHFARIHTHRDTQIKKENVTTTHLNKKIPEEERRRDREKIIVV